MNKTILQSSLLTILFIFSGLYSIVNAQFAGGSGTEADPYQVATAEQLDAVRDYLDFHFILTVDIDLGPSTGNSSGIFWNGGSGWDPVGDFNADINVDFNGVFDGNYKTISNLYINRPTEERVGLFGRTRDGSVIKNVTLHDVDITANSVTAAVVGQLYGTITHSSATGTVTGSGFAVGGLAGQINNTARVLYSYSDLILTGNSTAGGIGGSNGGEVSYSYSLDDVTATNSVAGGLIGDNKYGSITHSYSTGTVSASNDEGGLVGVNTEDMGGWSTYPSEGGTIINSFWDTEASGNAVSDGGTGITTTAMKTKTTFTDAGWDFDAIWQINEPESGNISYPYLQNNIQDPAPGYEVNNLPIASNVIISGSLTFEQTLTGSYDYSDDDGDAEGATIFQWYRSDDGAGTNRSAISGATNLTYTIAQTDVGKYISFEVTPNDGKTAGTAVESDFSGPVDSPFAGGEGTEAVPYKIATAEHLDYVRDFPDLHFILTADIDLGVSPWNVASGWEPIGENGNAFTGAIDGQGYTISGLTINRSTDYVGLFGIVGTGGALDNIGIEDASVIGSNNVGGLVGYLLDGTISNSNIEGKVNQNKNSGNDIGGLEETPTQSRTAM